MRSALHFASISFVLSFYFMFKLILIKWNKEKERTKNVEWKYIALRHSPISFLYLVHVWAIAKRSAPKSGRKNAAEKYDDDGGAGIELCRDNLSFVCASLAVRQTFLLTNSITFHACVIRATRFPRPIILRPRAHKKSEEKRNWVQSGAHGSQRK